jgi:hypothetical protein
VSLSNLNEDERPPVVADKSWSYLCLSRHDCLGIVCYKEYWPGLNRTRRIVLALIILFLGAAINLALYAITDVSCYRVNACSNDCSTYQQNCTTNVESLSVRDFGSSSTTVYTNLTQYNLPPARASSSWNSSYTSCSNAGNSIFNYSPVCVPLCANTSTALDAATYSFTFKDNATCNAQLASSHALVCETLQTRTVIIVNGQMVGCVPRLCV